MSSPSSPADLRHMTSHPNLATSHRLSQHLRTSPARSPTSIPSSPTSVHSSSSAIFERDIEPLAPPSPPFHSPHGPHHPPDPHRIPRSRTTEQIEHSVPSVLDSAAAILTAIHTPAAADVAVVAPASVLSPSSGFASPIGSFGSRSPSPSARHARSGSLLLGTTTTTLPQHPSSYHNVQASSPCLKPTPRIHTADVAPIPEHTSPPSLVTPTSAYFSLADDDSVLALSESGAHTTTFHPSSNPSSSASPGVLSSSSPISPISPPKTPIHPALSPISPVGPSSPTSTAAALTKRLSFISYADLLTSTPTSTLPLASLTTAASIEPPPHITGSLRGFGALSAAHNHYFHHNGGVNFASVDPFFPRTPPVQSRRASISAMLPGLVHEVDDLSGGEWEREGLGMGLEERLDVLYGSTSSPVVSVGV